MGFDTNTLEPRYKLEIGKPGSSFAFEIAGKIGLNPKIIAAARNKIGIQQQDIEQLLVQLEQEKAEIDRYKSLMEAKDLILDDLLNKTESREQDLKQQKRHILEQAREEATALLAKANKEIEQTIRTIKESAADKELTKMARTQLESVKTELKQAAFADQREEKRQQNTERENQTIAIGSAARIRDTQTIGTVVALGKNDAELAVGELRMTIKKNRLEWVSNADARRQQRAASSSVTVVAEAIGNFSPRLDLRGFRGQDALQELDRFLDKAVMASYNRLELLHGKGDGILRKLLREHLRKQRFVADFESEHADRGGDGITLVSLK
jgi:DNA mismatch repair protein MutS2